MSFTTETAKQAGRKSKRGKSKISLSVRRFLFEILNETEIHSNTC